MVQRRYVLFGLYLFTGALTANATTERTFATDPAADPFRRLTQTELNLGAYRARNGFPAESYWQQQVDYQLSARLDPANSRLTGSATVSYHNNSPDSLRHLFFALDHNALKPDSAATLRLAASADQSDHAYQRARALDAGSASGFKLTRVEGSRGQPLSWQVRDTLLQISLPEPLPPGHTEQLHFEWTLPLTEKGATGARSGFETLADNTRIYLAAQWFPRAMAYTDYAGWQLKPFLQQGEFSTEFGDYSVSIEVPASYTVAASGELKNPEDIFDAQQLVAWRSAAQAPIWLIDAHRAQQRRTDPGNNFLQWQFSGKRLRDFAFSASPAFLWQSKRDASGRRLQQFFPVEAAPLWEKFGLAAIEHTLSIFDAALMPLSDPSVSVVNTEGTSMEYPGFATVAARPERSESSEGSEGLPAWEAQTKYDFIGSVIHEVGHNYLPMHINTDEREWAWLDEGLVSFIEYRAEHAWEANFDVIYGEPRSIAAYTASAEHQPIMTSADHLRMKIDNAYNKTASILNCLRHLVLGTERFDGALAEFARAWEGRRPTPGDFFRAMETAAGADLSWFWRSWFYQNHSIDLGVEGLTLDGQRLALTPVDMEDSPAIALTAGGLRTFVVDQQPALADSYTRPLPQLPAEATPLTLSTQPDSHWYTLTLSNSGAGLLPIPIELRMANGERFAIDLPAQTWMKAQHGVLNLRLPVAAGLSLAGICLDPLWLTPDTRRSNNCVEVQFP
ncbi:M1 family metallopeptidase [Microbulbifer sp. SA54]|uniref:M1 family metallopeptidase n=1 Tax=Microbulbifer sp. SA54 TaxID=3401577 RepID=UPI003AAC690D